MATVEIMNLTGVITEEHSLLTIKLKISCQECSSVTHVISQMSGWGVRMACCANCGELRTINITPEVAIDIIRNMEDF